jgi:hypothetical protein
MRCQRFTGALLLCSSGFVVAEQIPKSEPLPPAESVMARVALNQDQAETERAHYVYVQHAKMVSRRGGTVMCEEITDYRMTPSSDGSHEELLNLDGRQLTKHQYVTYHALPPDQTKTKDDSKSKAGDSQKKDEDNQDSIHVTISDESMDRDIVENMRWNLIHDKSKDGIGGHLFPLTSRTKPIMHFAWSGASA